jgi:diacylglycerol kinase (ATP)
VLQFIGFVRNLILFMNHLSALMGNQNQTGLKRIYNACFYSFAGYKAAWQNEAAFRQEILLFLLTTPIAFWLGETKIEQLLLIGSVVLVLIVELLNSAVETLVDRVGQGHHELSGRAKDLASAAVMTSLLAAAATWIFVLI